ncbi:MCP methyltransferase, CheR-type [Desulfuromusa kysingii]|uniref:protein-glutamate O-methyltransferase n=1 Tax=Desulfuromusa kysingii TaxID=37625 RepID=A0A1H4AQR9_9BACT|nr:protein-glutamate O-methyltransferase CheR [Desulfuromusa kysingii]SEA38255.1 MCP methyltransferase, CheR-type [Desulfuromusa kysingii]
MTILADQENRPKGIDTTANELHTEPLGQNSPPFIGNQLDDTIYQQIADILQQQQNFNLGGYKDLCIKRRIAARIRTIGYHNPETYTQLLQQDTLEQQQLLAALSIHVSQFFRNESVFRALDKQILPELLEISRHNGSKLRIWSVGCANGEEPYSLALLCQKWRKKGDELSIIGTDLSPKALLRAKRGSFPADRISSVPSEMLADYFINSGDQYQLSDSIREQVQFFRHDIITDKPFYRATLILCRNLLIYFSREQQQKVLGILAAALLPKGYLVLGRAETLAPDCRKLFVCIDPAERIYQRVSEN